MENISADTQDIELAIKTILAYIGEDINREGIRYTPERIIRMWKEIFRGYDKKQIPKVTIFNNNKDGITYDQMIIDEGSFYSTCEHHALPFYGEYYFAYIPHPNGKILGLSKVARVVDFYSAKLQVQERLTSEIVEYLWDCLSKEGNEPFGMALVMKGRHLCKMMRGVKKDGEMTTSALKGVFLNNMTARTEFFNLIK